MSTVSTKKKEDRIEETKKMLDEALRRLAVAAAKEAGGKIECIERRRLLPITTSILLRLYNLEEAVKGIANILKNVREIIKQYDLSPKQVLEAYYRTLAPIINTAIDTYNNIINDIKHHYTDKDATAKTLKQLKPLQNPDELLNTLIELVNHTNQAKSYMIRWLPNC